jgi:hypothetical protein
MPTSAQSADLAAVGTSVTLSNSRNSTGEGPSSGSASSSQIIVRSVPVCTSGGTLARCLRTTLSCPTGQHIIARYRGLSTLPTPPGPGWTYLGQSCSGRTTPTPTFTLNDFQRLPLPPGVFTVQPPGGNVLINVPTIVYADPTPTSLTTTSLGTTIHIEATPTTWTWAFGDGSTLGPTHDPGQPYPSLTHPHTYTTPGEYPLTMTTTYTGRYHTGDGEWIPVDGTAQVTTPPTTITVLSAHADLVN